MYKLDSEHHMLAQHATEAEILCKHASMDVVTNVAGVHRCTTTARAWR